MTRQLRNDLVTWCVTFKFTSFLEYTFSRCKMFLRKSHNTLQNTIDLSPMVSLLTYVNLYIDIQIYMVVYRFIIRVFYGLQCSRECHLPVTMLPPALQCLQILKYLLLYTTQAVTKLSVHHPWGYSRYSDYSHCTSLFTSTR